MDKFFLVTLSFLVTRTFAQTTGDLIFLHITSAHTSFPGTGRTKGYRYDDLLYSTAEHYYDSSVLIVVPSQLKVKMSVDIVCWFHGWKNNIDSALAHYELARQFLASHQNAYLYYKRQRCT
jgi:hypothetical protein